jgi:hypothetical protein
LFSFLSIFIYGIRAQLLPAVAICGIAAAASEVVLTGAKTIQSCPATTEVFSQSSRAFARRRRTTPKFSPIPTDGKPPKKSASRIAESRALPTFAPSSYSPRRVCRTLALALLFPVTVAKSGTSALFVPALLPNALK